MPFVLDVRTSLSANAIQRVHIESGRDLLFVDSFDKKLCDAVGLNSERTSVTCPPERYPSQCIGPDILKTTVKFIMACLASSILHSFTMLHVSVEIWIALCMHFIWKEQRKSKRHSSYRNAWDSTKTGGLRSLLMNLWVDCIPGISEPA